MSLLDEVREIAAEIAKETVGKEYAQLDESDSHLVRRLFSRAYEIRLERMNREKTDAEVPF